MTERCVIQSFGIHESAAWSRSRRELGTMHEAPERLETLSKSHPLSLETSRSTAAYWWRRWSSPR